MKLSSHTILIQNYYYCNNLYWNNPFPEKQNKPHRSEDIPILKCLWVKHVESKMVLSSNTFKKKMKILKTRWISSQNISTGSCWWCGSCFKIWSCWWCGSSWWCRKNAVFFKLKSIIQHEFVQRTIVVSHRCRLAARLHEPTMRSLSMVFLSRSLQMLSRSGKTKNKVYTRVHMADIKQTVFHKNIQILRVILKWLTALELESLGWESISAGACW